MGGVMKRSGASLLVYALEQIGVRYTFGIPGVHNTEIYDELNKSNQIQPVLVTHECGAAFMADAISRTTASIGTLVIVPAAGMTHAMSGIGEAYLDGIPMLAISGGTRRDSGRFYQLHQLDQHRILEGITKQSYLIEHQKNIVPTIYEAYKTAVSGEPGPVFVEIPVEIQLFRGEVEEPQLFNWQPPPSQVDKEAVRRATGLLAEAKQPGLFLGWGARDCTELSIQIAELLNAPVSTTLQGLSVFPGSHPLHTGMSFGKSSVPAAEQAFANCDCLLAVGTRFGEIPTGSFGLQVPEKLIHIDINPEVFDKNYPSKVAIEGDASQVMGELLAELKQISSLPKIFDNQLKQQIKKNKQGYREEWNAHLVKDRVNPNLFFESLRQQLHDDAYTVVDDGNHTFLSAELFPVYQSKHFISPTDFNCMGYAVPAAVGTKLAHPDQQVVAIVGDGAFLMTCMEILTATTLNLGVVFFVFYDGELAQIAQGQQIPYNRKTCTVLGNLGLYGVAQATGAGFVELLYNDQIEFSIKKALEMAEKGQPVIVDVRIDYSKKTRFTQGVIKTNLSRFPLGEKVRFVGRALARKIVG